MIRMRVSCMCASSTLRHLDCDGCVCLLDCHGLSWMCISSVSSRLSWMCISSRLSWMSISSRLSWMCISSRLSWMCISSICHLDCRGCVSHLDCHGCLSRLHQDDTGCKRMWWPSCVCTNLNFLGHRLVERGQRRPKPALCYNVLPKEHSNAVPHAACRHTHTFMPHAVCHHTHPFPPNQCRPQDNTRGQFTRGMGWR